MGEVAHQGFPLTRAELEVVELYTTVNGMMLRDFYGEAYVAQARARSEWEPQHELDRYAWRAYPTGVRKSVVTYQEDVRELEEWAERDNIKKAFAHYTAVYNRILRARAELLELGYPLKGSRFGSQNE